MIELGVNIDHIATVRQARRTVEPDPVTAAALAELGGADGITVHLREDRRHICDRDVRILRQTIRSRMNLEMAVAEEIVAIAAEIVPDQATLVPEKRQEVTTEGRLDAVGSYDRLERAVKTLQQRGVVVSLFLDPVAEQIAAAKKMGAEAVELHTGSYANAPAGAARDAELAKLAEAGRQIVDLGMRLHAGHGLTYFNVLPVARLPRMRELNIGHSIIARALFTGLSTAVAEMKSLLRDAAAGL